VYERSRRHLMVELYRYRTEKGYKAEGFGSFAAAFRYFSDTCGWEVKVTTLRKYFALFDTYREYGYEIEDLCRYPVSRLLQLKPFLKRISKEEFARLMRADKNKFIIQLNKIMEGLS
jgi:hypothetical protein